MQTPGEALDSRLLARRLPGNGYRPGLCVLVGRSINYLALVSDFSVGMMGPFTSSQEKKQCEPITDLQDEKRRQKVQHLSISTLKMSQSVNSS